MRELIWSIVGIILKEGLVCIVGVILKEGLARIGMISWSEICSVKEKKKKKKKKKKLGEVICR